MSIISIEDWKKNKNNISASFQYEDCAKVFVEFFKKVNNEILINRYGNKVVFSIPKDHNDISNLWVVASAKFFEAGYKEAFGDNK